MKFGVSLWLWTSPVTNDVIESYAPKIAKLGFDTVEIPIEDPDALDCDAAHRTVKNSGLTLTTCAAMGGGRDLIHPAKSVRNDGMKYIKDSLDAAEKLGSNLFVGPLASEIEEKDLGDAIRTAGKDLYHFQVAENDRGTPGTGQFDWDGIAVALDEIGYDRHVIIETFTPDNELLAKAAAIWRPLADSPDQLAKDGLAFMKQLLS